MKERRKGFSSALVVGVIVLLAVVGGGAPAGGGVDAGWTIRDVGRDGAGLRASPAAPSGVRAQARTAATWCGTPSQVDLTPNAVAGYPVHWIYAIPSDGQDRSSTVESTMQTDAQTIDAWWRGQDPTRTPRFDLAPFSCGLQLDISSVRLPQSNSQLSSSDGRFVAIANDLIGAGLGSHYDKYLVYFDGSVSDQNLCGQGGSAPSGLGYAVLYVQACAGVPGSVIAAHEMTHTFGAVPVGAPHMCPAPNDGHVCDDAHDLMYPFADGTPLSGLVLDRGRDDYYGHSGAWSDVQDSPWLDELDRQVPFSLTIAGPGSIAADVPGLQCSQSCTTTWNAGTQLVLGATPSAGAKLVGWTGACSGSSTCSVAVTPGAAVSALFGPSSYRLTVAVSGRGTVRSSRSGISCPRRCSASLPSYVPLRLTAKAANGWRLKAWTGACRGSKPVCTIPMTANTRARAVFKRR